MASEPFRLTEKESESIHKALLASFEELENPPMASEPMVTDADMAEIMVIMARLGLPTDVQSVLVHGDNRGTVPPHVLSRALAPVFARHRQAALIEGVRLGIEAGKENWDGLARAIMMAFDMGAKTPRALFKHLTLTGREIPDWMREESEMKALDHVPSKGTRAVLIYRAMTEDLSPEAIAARAVEKQDSPAR